MEFDRFTVVLLLLREDAPTLDEKALDALQDAHLDHLARLHEDGHLLAAGPSPGTADRRLRGFCLFRVDPDQARALEAKDPAVLAGRFAIEAHTWMVPRGAMRFTPTRFPHSAAEAERG
jgi:uncharacterized protein YciI